MGSVDLVKSVLQVMALYSFHVYEWSENPTSRQLVIVAWKKGCLPINERGLIGFVWKVCVNWGITCYMICFLLYYLCIFTIPIPI